MSTVTVTRLVDAPADELWRIFTDLHRRAAVLSTVESIEVLTRAPFGPGTRWREIRRGILEFQAQVGKPLLFTEAGWCSQEGCSVEAWNYYRTQVATPAGLEEQRRNYRAFVETWAEQPALGGIIWWEWTEGFGGPTDYGYTPRNKPAEAVLRDLFQQRSTCQGSE